jgi:hypothetical protein
LISSNTLFQSIVLFVLVAHAGALIGVWYLPRGFGVLLSLNTVVALSVLTYAACRARYILAAMDWPYLALVVFELIVLFGAYWAFKENRVALIWSYVAFGLHACVSIGAVVFAFVFKITKLM